MDDEAELYNELTIILEKYKHVYLNFNEDLVDLYEIIKFEVKDYTYTK